MASVTDWGSGGQPGFLRDPANEQTVPLAPNAVFTGQWTRVDKALSFLLLYGTHVPFTMQIQWSADGVTRDLDPFATITPQVRSALGLYSVISPQSTFFRPFYRMVITNGPSQQLFVVSDSILLNSIFPGYQISVGGPIPVLGLMNLNSALGWSRGPAGWVANPATAIGNPKIALAEDLVGVATQTTLAAVLAALAPLQPASYRRVNTSGTTLVKSGPGTLLRLIVSGVGTATTITIYDSLTASGPVILTLKTVNNTAIPIEVNAAFTTGLTVAALVATDFTVIYR